MTNKGKIPKETLYKIRCMVLSQGEGLEAGKRLIQTLATVEEKALQDSLFILAGETVTNGPRRAKFPNSFCKVRELLGK